MRGIFLIIFAVVNFCAATLAQENISLYDKAFLLPDKFFGAINKKTEKIEQQMLTATGKALKKMEKRELRLQKKMALRDSAAACKLFGNVKERYAKLRGTLQCKSGLQQVYSPHMDSMKAAFGFLQQGSFLQNEKATHLFAQYKMVQDKFNQTAFIHGQLKQRQQQLKEKIMQVGLQKDFRKFQTNVYYYRRQVDEYKKIFESPRKLEATLMTIVGKIPAFQAFFNKHSELASVFRFPGSEEISSAALNEMQTREVVMQTFSERLGTGRGANQFVGNNITSAQSALEPLKNKLNTSGAGDLEMPGFKPNTQKTKTFLQRIEWGGNMQSAKSNFFSQ